MAGPSGVEGESSGLDEPVDKGAEESLAPLAPMEEEPPVCNCGRGRGGRPGGGFAWA